MIKCIILWGGAGKEERSIVENGTGTFIIRKKKGRRGEGIMIKYIGKRILMMIPVMFE